MARLIRNSLVMFLIFALIGLNLSKVQAARGTPGSAEFGIGAAIYPDGPNLKQALEMATDLELDWLEVPVNWAKYEPEEGATNRLDLLDPVMQVAAEHQISVLVSLTGTPPWAQTPQGPDPARAAAFIRLLLERYPSALAAVELFPGANTLEGWGAAPGPAAYLSLYRQVATQVKETEPRLLLVAAGLRPLPAEPVKGDLDDLEFLRGLYAEGGSEISIVSLQLPDLTGKPADFPQGRDRPVLRHYEEVRQVMSANQHKNDLIWITQINPPSGTIDISDDVSQDLNIQSNWLSTAYVQIRSQLYVGVTVAQSLNPPTEGTAARFPCLIGSNGAYHPFYSVLHEMISLNRTGSVTIQPGTSKEGKLQKRP